MPIDKVMLLHELENVQLHLIVLILRLKIVNTV